MPFKERTKVMAQKVTGTIADWKGTFGWIDPRVPIQHPLAAKRGGRIYLAQVDVEAEISGIGAEVEFFVYSDVSGLGAMNCRPATSSGGGPGVQRTIAKNVPPPSKKGKAAGGKAAATAMATATAAAMATATADGGMGGGAGAKGGKGGKKERVSNSQFTGEMICWNGRFGWIRPLEPVKHPDFQDKIYLAASDIAPSSNSGELAVGVRVCFYIYKDHRGLGAERCEVLIPALQPGGSPAAEVLEQRPPPAAQPTPQQGGKKGVGGKGGNSGPDLPRERITNVPTTGEVIDWKGSFGWIKPHEPVEHAEASKRGGRVYVSKKDLQGIADLHAGQLVQFHVFVDSSGLGADECSPF